MNPSTDAPTSGNESDGRGPIKTFDVLGVRVSAVSLSRAVGAIAEWIEARRQEYVCVTGVHGIMESLYDPGLRSVHNRAGLVTPDGMPLVWLGRFAGHTDIGRVYGPDLMLAVCEASVRHGWRMFFFGGGEGVAEQLADKLRQRYPSLTVVGTYCPPFGPFSDQQAACAADAINNAEPDIVWVGLSTPKQERWMATNRSKLRASVLLGVGAAFDFHAGLKPQAPKWMQRSGLEWSFRLITEPRRLWRRYATNNPLFVYYTLLQLIGLRRFK